MPVLAPVDPYSSNFQQTNTASQVSSQALSAIESELKRAHKLMKKIQKNKFSRDVFFVPYDPSTNASFSVTIDVISQSQNSAITEHQVLYEHTKYSFVVETVFRRLLYTLSSPGMSDSLRDIQIRVH